MNYKIADRAILIMFTGTISAFIANLFGYLSRLIYPDTIIMPELALKTWINPASAPFILNLIVGNLSSFIAGEIHAVGFIYLLDKTGWRYLWLKSFGVSTTGWMLSSFIFLRLIKLNPEAINDIYANLFFYGAHLVYLTVSSFIVKKIGVPERNLRSSR